MKPISLTMQAFGSYGEKTTIDFTKPTQNLFLITGDTGSGKTTIFDAIVFALYGKASSTNNTRDGKNLQSQYANITVEPFVELVFSEKCSLDEEIYTVRRVPMHQRVKGQTNKSETISLVMPDGCEYPYNLTESNKKLEEIVGLTREQFMQIAMIAQGEFMKLLRSKSNDKKEIYRKLFGTEQYDKIVKEFKKRRADKLSEIQEIKAICQTDISRVSVSSDEEGAQDLLELQERIRSSDELNIVDMESFLKQLKTLCDHLQEKEREAKTKKEKTAKVRDEKQKKLTRAESLLSAFDQLNSAKNELDECEKNEPGIKEKKRLSQTIDISYELKGACGRYLDANKQVKQTEKVLREQQANLPSLEQKRKVADEAKNTAEEKWQEATQKYSKVEDRVKKASSVFAEISEKEKALDKANGELQKANGTFNSTKKKFDDFERQVGEWNKEKNDLAGTTLKLEKCNRKIEDAEGILADINSLEETKQNISSLTDAVEVAKQAYISARDEYESKNKEYQAKRGAFFNAQAGILAKEKLAEGKPCPVCGSLDHPSPCELPEEHQGLTREEIENLEWQVSQCNKNQQEKSEEVRSLGVQLDGQQTSYEEKFRKLKERIATVFPDTFATLPDDFSLDAAKSIINKQKKALLTEQNDLSKKAARLSEIEGALKTAEAKTKELKEKQTKAEQNKDVAQQTVSSCTVKLETLRKSQTEYSSEDEADNVLNQAKSEKAAAETAYKHAKDAAEEAKSKRDRAKTLINDYTEKLPGLEEERDAHKDNYEALLREKNIPEETWKKTVDQYTKEQASKFRNMVTDHNEKLAAAKRAYNNAKAQIGDEQQPNIDELKADVQQAEKDFQTADDVHSEIRNNYDKNNEVYQNLASTMDKRKQIVQTYDQIESMYGRLAGKVSGGKMDLETFAQRYYLQQILIAANARFQKMSGGQFELRMVDQEEASEGKTNTGLDLNVYSTVTETERNVQTLSGGESFMAALSLALGIADQIRSSSAAVNLDIMFIDEGFGSLDEESRNQAVRVLQDMAGGEKLVGIISHVTELKQQIDDQLIVTKDDKGSHTKWQLS